MSKGKKTIEELLDDALVPEEAQPYEVRENWVWVTLGSVVSTVKGKKPKELLRTERKGTIPYVTISYMTNGKSEETQYLIKSSSKVECKYEDILMVWDGARSGLVGKGVSGEVGSTLVKLNNSKLFTNYLYYFLESKYNFINKNHRGTGIPHVNPEVLWTMPFPVPPLNEQKRIADRVERLFNNIEEAKQLIKGAKETFELRRASILDKAFNGELTRKWRNEKNKEDALEYITALRKSSNYEGNDDISEPYSLPSGWRWAKIGELFHVQVGSTPSRKKDEYWNGEYPWLSSGEVQFNTINESREHVTDLAVKESRLKLSPKGSILFGMIGEGKTRGQVALLNMDAFHNQNTASIWVSKTKISSLYVYYWLLSQYNQNRQNSAGNNQPAYNKSRVQELLIPIAPLDEIDVIVDKLQRMLNLEESINNLLLLEGTINDIKQSILSKAYQGELGTNDYSDVNAIELLKEILQEQVK